MHKLSFQSLLGLFLITVAIIAGHSTSYADSVVLTAGSSATMNYVSTFGVAGAATATFSLSADGSQLIVNFQNVSTENTYLSGLGFNTTPDLSVASYQFSSLPNGSQWSLATGSGGGMGKFDLIPYGNGNNNRLGPGQSGILTITLATPAPQGITLDVSLVHLTSLPDGSSQKPVGVLVGGNPPPPAPVPEPATMLLLGSGLATLWGVRRRTKRNR